MHHSIPSLPQDVRAGAVDKRAAQQQHPYLTSGCPGWSCGRKSNAASLPYLRVSVLESGLEQWTKEQRSRSTDSLSIRELTGRTLPKYADKRLEGESGEIQVCS